MAIPSVDDVIEVAVEADFDETEDVVNVFQLQVPYITASTIVEFVDSLEDWVTNLLAVLRPLANAYVVWRRFRWRNLTTQSNTQSVELTAPLAGTAAGATLPPGNALLLGFRPGFKNVLLKKYFGPPSHTNLSAEGQWNNTQLILMAAAGAFLMVDQAETYATFRYGYLRPVFNTFHEPNSYFLAAEGAYQRRRRRGTGS